MTAKFLRRPPPVAIITLQGEYDLFRREELLATLEAIPICDIAIIDMRQVTHIDATVLTSFLKLERRLRKNGKGIVRILGLKPSLYRLFQITGLHCIFEVFHTITGALGEYGYSVNRRSVHHEILYER